MTVSMEALLGRQAGF